MKALALLLTIAFSFQIQATTLDDFFTSNKLENVCNKTLRTSNGNIWRTFKPRFVYHNDNLFYAIRESGNQYTVTQLTDINNSNALYVSSHKIVDIEVNGNILWIAHKEYINKYDLITGQTSKIRTLPVDRQLTKHEVIHDIHYMQGILYVAQGVRGVFALDETSDQVIWNEYFNINQSNGHRSKVINIVGENGILFAGLDNLTMPTRNSVPFNGFIKFDASNPQGFTESPYDRRRAGIMAYAHTTIQDNVVYINNMGHLQYIDTSAFKANKKLRPKWYPNWYQDIDLRRTAMWKGNVLVKNDTAYGCAHFSYFQNQPKPQKVARPLITNF
jgi:outer membrane protein assembly factor BamB